LPDDVFDHPFETHPPAVVRGVDTGDTVPVQLFDLAGEDGAAAAAEKLDVSAAILIEKILDILEEFQMAALIGRDGDALYIFFDGAFDDFGCGAVVTEVDDLGALRLQQPPHDIDRGIMAVEKRSGGNQPDLI